MNKIINEEGKKNTRLLIVAFGWVQRIEDGVIRYLKRMTIIIKSIIEVAINIK